MFPRFETGWCNERENEPVVILKRSCALRKRRWYFDLSTNKRTDLTIYRMSYWRNKRRYNKYQVGDLINNNLEFFARAFATFLTTTANILRVSNHISENGNVLHYVLTHHYTQAVRNRYYRYYAWYRTLCGRDFCKIASCCGRCRINERDTGSSAKKKRSSSSHRLSMG